MPDLFGGGTDLFGGSSSAPAPAAGGDLFGGTDLFGGSSTPAPAPGTDLFGAPAPAGGGTSNLFGGDIFAGSGTDLFGGTSTTGAQVRLPEVWPDETTLGDKYSDIVRKDKERLHKYCAVQSNGFQQGTFKSEFQQYFEREPASKTQVKLPSQLPEWYFTREPDPRKGNKQTLYPVGVMVLLHQYDQKIREVKQTIAEKIQPVINELKKLSADLRRNTLKQKNVLATRYNALKVPDGSAGDYDGGLGGVESVRTLRDVLTRDIRIMQYVGNDDDDATTSGRGMGMGGGAALEFPSSHIKVEVSDLYRRKRDLAVQIKELESALLGAGSGGGGGGGDLSSDLVRIIEEQFKMYETIGAKVAVIHQRVEEEKQAIRAELRANPDGKVDPWLEERADPTEKRFREYREQKEKKERKEKADRAQKKLEAEQKKAEKAKKKAEAANTGTNNLFGGTDIWGTGSSTTTTSTSTKKKDKDKKDKNKGVLGATTTDNLFGSGSLFG